MKLLRLFPALCLLGIPCFAQMNWPIKQFRPIDAKNLVTSAELTFRENASLFKVLCQIAELSECTEKAVFHSFQMERAALSGNKKDSLIIQGSGSSLCGATGNCTFIVSDSEAHFVLNTYGVQGFVVTSHLSHGRFDIVTSQHESATESTMRRFRFDGRRYRAIECAELVYGDLTHPNGPPHITAISCANGPEER